MLVEQILQQVLRFLAERALVIDRRQSSREEQNRRKERDGSEPTSFGTSSSNRVLESVTVLTRVARPEPAKGVVEWA